MRSMLNQIQGFKSQGMTSIKLDDVKKFTSVYQDIFELIIKNTDPIENYKLIVGNYSNKVDEVLSSLGDEFINYIEQEQQSLTHKTPQIIVTVAKYQSQRLSVIDPIISLLACVYELQTIIKN